ncbi:MAG: PaaI family thioesterase [Desulfobacterales bacterium]
MTDAYKTLTKGYSHKCFGCSQTNPYGLKMTFLGNQTSVVSHITVPEFMCGWSPLVHGGILSVILDEIMSWSALHVLKKIVLTRSMTIDFIKPVSVGEALTAWAAPIKRTGRNQALVEGRISDSRQTICATSQGNFALLKPKTAMRLGIIDENGMNVIENILSSG